MIQNPFNITKAVDLSDKEILDYWVDMSRGKLLQRVKPSSPMPMLVLGGKGSGKTHLLRYISYPVQKLRYSGRAAEALKADKYVGVYIRCSGLNAMRFVGKGQDEDTWSSVFAYYIELWLSQALLSIIQDAIGQGAVALNDEAEFVKDACALFDSPVLIPPGIAGLQDLLATFQRELDAAVNNCAITHTVDVNVRITEGRCVFGLPKVIRMHLTGVPPLLFVYLIDEFENLTERQQRYVQTLVREKEPPSAFKIGSKLYGVRTFRTFSADEENKEGSEYETLPLDAVFREKEDRYREFATALVSRRLCEAGVACGAAAGLDVASLFRSPPGERFCDEEVAFVPKNYGPNNRPYLLFLRAKLQQGMDAGAAPGIRSPADIDGVIRALQDTQHPLVEKLNVFLLYQDWYRRHDLKKAATDIGQMGAAFADGDNIRRHREALSHYKYDLLAQLFRECSQPQRYYGFGTFVDMSQGLPRNLLIILKHVFTWAQFNGEMPFAASPISIRSQVAGVAEACEWFYRDARMPGSDGPIVQSSMNRLGELFRALRFSDKPSECSLCTFSANLSEATEVAQRVLRLAESWSWLINVAGGQKDRNTMRVDVKYQINSMLSPRWELPIYRRGALALSSEEVNAVFDPEYASRFDGILKSRVQRVVAPWFGRSIRSQRNPSLPGLRA